VVVLVTGTLMFMSMHLVLVIMVVVVGVRVPWVVLLIVPGMVRVVPARSVVFMSVHLVLVIMVVVVGVRVPFVLLVVSVVVGVVRGMPVTVVVPVTMLVRVVCVFIPVMVMIVPVMPMIVGVVFVIERFAQLHVSLLVTPEDGRDQHHPHQQQLPEFDSLLEHSLPPLLRLPTCVGEDYQTEVSGRTQYVAWNEGLDVSLAKDL